MKTMSLLLLAVAGALHAPSQNLHANSVTTPILVELFTSEGCSSCPPADAWLAQMDSMQPVSGAQLIVMSEHVDYWDHEGWKDPYSSAQFTDRQDGYVRLMGLSSPYTPQMIADGEIELQLSQPDQARRALAKAASMITLPVGITSMRVEPSVLTAHITVGSEQNKRSADIFAAITLNHAESQVAHGENRGRLLKHVAVVQELVKVGKLEKTSAFSQDVRLKLPPHADGRNLRLIVFAQEAGLGRVLGAAVSDSSTAGK
jgi:hypothetical protein